MKEMVGLPWWLSSKESASQCRRDGFNPWSGKILYATEQLTPCTATTKPCMLQPVLHKRSHHSEKLKHQTKSKPLLTATRERHAATKTQHSGGVVGGRARKDKHRELLTDSELCYNIFRV